MAESAQRMHTRGEESGIYIFGAHLLLRAVTSLRSGLELVTEPVAARDDFVLEVLAVAKAEVLVGKFGAAAEHDACANDAAQQEVLVRDNEAERAVVAERGGVEREPRRRGTWRGRRGWDRR